MIQAKRCLMSEYKIIDNFLDEEDFNRIESAFFPESPTYGGEIVPWSINEGIVRDKELGPTGYEENDWMYTHLFSGLGHHPATKTWRYVNSEHLHLIKPIVKKLEGEVIIARTNLLPPTDNHIHHLDHTDRKEPHQVALLYITNNNGHTVLKDTAEVECVKNRMVIFDGSILHHSVTSTDKMRCVININFTPYLKIGKLNANYK